MLQVRLGVPLDDIVISLTHYGTKITRRSLQRRLSEWNIQTERALSAKKITGPVIEAVQQAFCLNFATDRVLAQQMKDQGIDISARQIKKIRLANGWRVRDRDVKQQEQLYQRVLTACWEAVEEGVARNYGRILMSSYLKTVKGIRATLNHVQAALKEIHHVTQINRRPGMKSKKRGQVDFHGPDYLWSLDGHDKLSRFGIQIYGAIDAYSRQIQWLYVGNSNKTQISVVKQFLQAIKSKDWCPRYIRADRGVELTLLAEAQLSLFSISRVRDHGLTAEEAQNIPLQDCFLFGPSTANIKIESFWIRLIKAQTQPWMVSKFGFLSCDND
jgi:hypothetical protein